MRLQRQAAGALALALVTIGAALIAGPGNTAHPLRSAWVLVGLVCAALGMLILTLLVVERPRVTAQQDQALRDLLQSARGAVQNEQLSRLAEPPPPWTAGSSRRVRGALSAPHRRSRVVEPDADPGF
jgi:hypothetical protein